MQKAIVTLTAVLLSAALHAQIHDSSRVKIPGSWKKFHPGIRVAAGIQKSFYTEAGITWQRYQYDARHGFVATAYYASFQWTPPTKGNEKVQGVKAGTELVNNGAAGGIEFSYLWNSVHNDFVITPKIGFGIGLVNLYYGYNFSTNKYPFPDIRKSQFSLAVNTNLLFFQTKYDKK